MKGKKKLKCVTTIQGINITNNHMKTLKSNHIYQNSIKMDDSHISEYRSNWNFHALLKEYKIRQPLWKIIFTLFLLYYYYYFLFVCLFVFRAAPAAYKVPSQGLHQSCSCWPAPQPQLCQIQAISAIYTTAHGNTTFLTH